MCSMPDNYSLWEAHDREQCAAEQQEQRCAWCSGILGDVFYEIGAEYVCEECIDGCRRYM